MLQANEYYDAENDEKQEPYSMKLISAAPSKEDDDAESGNSEEVLSSGDLKETYYVHVNLHRRTIEAGEQVFGNYGSYSNKHLMLQYGFCYADNRYNTVEVRMRIDMSIMDHALEELIDYRGTSRSFQKLFLGGQLINHTLVAYFRALLKQKFNLKPNLIIQNANVMQNFFIMQEVLISTPSNILYEKMVLEHYLELLNILDASMNRASTLEDDCKTLATESLPARMAFSVLYRIEQKRVIKSQLNIIGKTLQVIEKASEILTADYKSKEAPAQSRAFSEYIMEPTEAEKA